MLVIATLLFVVAPPLFVRWQLQRHGWEIGDRHFGGGPVRSWLREFASQWMTPVEHLWMEDRPVQQTDVVLLRTLTHTKHVYFNRSSVPEQAIRAISEFPNLEQLEFFDVILDPAGIEHLAKCRALKVLEFGYMQVDDKSLIHLEHLPHLTEFRHHETGSEGLEHIAKFVQLQSLEIDDGRFTKADLSALARLPKLRRLWLGECPVTDEGAKILADSCPNLVELNLRGDQLSDAAMTHLARLPNLEILILNDQPITDGGLYELRTSTTLKRVNVRETNVTQTGIQELKRANPKIEVYP